MMDAATLAALLYDFAHDLHAPVRAVDGFSRALSEDWGREPSPTSTRYLQRITQNAARLQQYADWVGRFASALEPPRAGSSASLGAAFAEAAADLNARGGPVRIELDLDHEQNLGWDGRHLKLLVASLQVYATKVLHGQAGLVRITQQRSEHESTVRASIQASPLPDLADPPSSNASAELDRAANLELGIFTAVLSHYQGASLRLLSPALLEIVFGQHEGVATEEERPLQQTEITTSTATDKLLLQTVPSCHESASLGKLLVIDDDPADIELFQAAVEDWIPTQEMEFFRDPIEAIRQLRALADTGQVQLLPHVVFVDLRMPRCNGLEIVRAIKGEPLLSLVPTVVLSSSANPAEVQAAYRAGANAFVVKSVDFQKFTETIRHAARFWMNYNQRPVR
jgi:CheY-like chemotaxis protein